ncbi:hypothetical protein [Acetivibrio straminisolvens]|uniref:Uncharacterized protein n=1 Tax=Acetivibrio straminisolvens JCM 21531 TaxID=1294263 RepID=W4V9B2_9FIRM|nr:hypothetical protein [Acetivibrio straminisolvens]GAE89771.1 hypothetical protein JCM21531_3329 [Acetivibrio straminisolvens JCM 21531]
MSGYSFVYVKIDRNNSMVHSTGITFKDFSMGLNLDKCYLILAGYSHECRFNTKLLLEYVTKEQARSLIEQDVYAFGDFCWVDFENEKQLHLVTDEELARLLFMSHQKRPLGSFRIDSLMNEYGYLCHDDGYCNYTYLYDIKSTKTS